MTNKLDIDVLTADDIQVLFRYRMIITANISKFRSIPIQELSRLAIASQILRTPTRLD
ncbi:hypothetical protein [Gloeothece citriformis]|uniref:hypothetical protein n=1 Tax=Gloeothece citriformis TaxID=2546356 RepID=UPI0012FF266B|nr:hypothetical protein [Gloeothece citriformis]